MPASSANTPMCSALARQKSRKSSPAADVAHAAVDREHELDPVADAEPVDDARRVSPAGSGAAGRGSRAQAISSGVSATGASQTRLKRGKQQNQQQPPRAAPAASSASRAALRFFADQVGHVRTAHQRSAEDHLEADGEAVIAIRVELLAASTYSATGRLRRVGCRYWPMVATSTSGARRSRSSCVDFVGGFAQPDHEARLRQHLRTMAARERAARRATAGNRPAAARGGTAAARSPCCG